MAISQHLSYTGCPKDWPFMSKPWLKIYLIQESWAKTIFTSLLPEL